jgi:hypothetical protein
MITIKSSMSTTQSTKQWSKVCLTSALERLQQEHGDDNNSTTDAASLTALAVAAIEQLTNLLGTDETYQEDRRELKRVSKTIRKLQTQIEEATSSSSSDSAKQQQKEKEQKQQQEQEQEKLDLGQYAKAGVFDNDDKKKSKFARLMGGAKKEGKTEAEEELHHEHTTFALTKKEQKIVESELEKEFEMGRHHHGKKGLGAK